MAAESPVAGREIREGSVERLEHDRGRDVEFLRAIAGEVEAAAGHRARRGRLAGSWGVRRGRVRAGVVSMGKGVGVMVGWARGWWWGGRGGDGEVGVGVGWG